MKKQLIATGLCGLAVSACNGNPVQNGLHSVPEREYFSPSCWNGEDINKKDNWLNARFVIYERPGANYFMILSPACNIKFEGYTQDQVISETARTLGVIFNPDTSESKTFRGKELRSGFVSHPPDSSMPYSIYTGSFLNSGFDKGGEGQFSVLSVSDVRIETDFK